MTTVVETQFQQRPMRAHGAAGSDSPEGQLVRHKDLWLFGLELFFEGPDIKFMRPGAAILRRKVPGGVSNLQSRRTAALLMTLVILRILMTLVINCVKGNRAMGRTNAGFQTKGAN